MKIKSKVNRKKVVDKFPQIVLMFLFLQIFLLESKGQDYFILFGNASKYCTSVLYYGVNNPIKLIVHGNKKVKNIKLTSDSIIIKKINDSLYNFLPLHKKTYCRLYIINALTNKRIDSIVVYTDSEPFVFSITHRNVAHEFFTNYDIIKEMNLLYIDAKGKDCFDYSEYFIVSYELVLQRDETEIVSTKLKFNQLVENSFKKKLIKTSKTGDILYAKNILVKNKKNGELRIDKFGLYKIK